MPKANRTCYCCGRKYYYCPSCPDDRRSPSVFIMWDSELCKDIFNVLTNESTKKITTLECKNKLIELGVTKDTVLKKSVRNHVDRVMSYEEEIVKEINNNIMEAIPVVLEETDKLEEKVDIEEITVEAVDSMIIETTTVVDTVEPIKKIKRTRRSSLKNKENSEVD